MKPNNLIVTSLILAVVCCASMAAVSYDLTTDWVSVDSTATNNWKFGYEPIPGGAFTEFLIHDAAAGIYDIWWDGSEPWIAKAGPSWNWAPAIPGGFVIMHPGPLVSDGGDGSKQCAVARFIVTVAGTYDITGCFEGRDVGTKSVYVQKNGTTLLSEPNLISNAKKNINLTSVVLAVGDEVDFIIMAKVAYNTGQVTALYATLTKQAAPSTTMWDATTDYIVHTLPPINNQTQVTFGPWQIGNLPVVNNSIGSFVSAARKWTRTDGFDTFDNGTVGDSGLKIDFNWNYTQNWWFKPRPNWSVIPQLNGYPCLRFIAPQSGVYTITCSFSGVAGGAFQPGGDPNSHATVKAHIDSYITGVRTSLFAQDVNGFDGEGLVDIADGITPAVSSPAPTVVNANITGVNLAQGAAVEFYADPRGNAQFDNTYLSPVVVRTGNYIPTCAEAGVYTIMDFNHDCYVNFKDLAEFALKWLTCNDPRNVICTH